MGIEELRHIIDKDSRQSKSIEYAEQHYLAWLLGRYGALRPGSLGKPSEVSINPDAGPQYLIWRDLVITRGRALGEFDVRVLIRNIKTDRPDPEADAAKSLNFLIKSPQEQSNLALSVPHRILAIALCRDIL